MDTKDLIVSTSAVLGAVLGIFNLARSYLTDAERGSITLVQGDDKEHPGVEVVNRSHFPLTITDLGTVHPDGQVSSVGLNWKFAEVDRLPKRIDARDSHTFRIDMHETIARVVHKPKYTYARTALGKVFTSERALVRWWRFLTETLHLKARDL
jgi:hypothetical protein